MSPAFNRWRNFTEAAEDFLEFDNKRSIIAATPLFVAF